MQPRKAYGETIEGALPEFAALLGDDGVVVEREQRMEYRDPFWPDDDETYDPSVVLLPTTTEQVQEIVRIAGRHGIPVSTHSTGRNNSYGGAGVRLGGTVSISLRRMNRVLEVNGTFGYVVVEPGARWFDIHDAIKASGHRYMLSIPDLGWGGAVGNSLDNGISYLPIGKNEQPVCGMEVVLADGSLLRTGTGAVPGSKTWHLHRRGLGPTLDPLFAQSNFGIVTKMGLWLMPLPEVFASLQMKLWGVDDIASAVDIIRELRLKGVLDGVPTIGTSLTVAAMVSRREQWTDDPTPIGDELRERIGRELNIGFWTGRLGLWGDEDVVDLNLAKIRRAFEAIPGAEIIATKYTADQLWEGEVPEHDQVQAGIPNMFTSNFMDWYSDTNGAHWSVSPIVPLDGESFVEVSDLLRSRIEEAGFDYFDGCMVNSDRSVSIVGTICFDRDNPEHVRNVREVAHGLAAELGSRGYGEYRAHTDVMEAATAQYGWNGFAYRRFVERIKDAVDPQGILNPGRYGIWPAGLRGSEH